MREWAFYTLGRLSAVITRPLCLYLGNNYLVEETTLPLAIIFLASSIGLTVSAADSHRQYYGNKFLNRSVNGISFYVYLSALFQSAILGVIFSFGISMHFTGSMTLATFSVILFSIDKIADEIQRMRLFERDFVSWGRNSLLRGSLQIAVITIAVLAGLNSPEIISAGIVTAAAVVFIPQVPSGLWKILENFETTYRLACRGSEHLWRRRQLWMVIVLGAGVSFLDRIFLLIIAPAVLPLFMLIVMAFSLVQMAVDFYYISRHRCDFLEQRIDLIKALMSRGFLASLCGGLACGALATVAILNTSRDGGSFPIAYVFFIAALQILVAVSMLPQQILYWNECEGKMLRIEFAFWVILAIVFGFLNINAANLEAGLVMIVGVTLVRLWLLALGAYKLQRQ